MSDPRWLSDVPDAGRRALRDALDETPPFASSDVRRRRVWAELGRSGARNRVARRAFTAGAMLASLLTAVVLLSSDHFLRGRRAPAGPARPIAAVRAAVPSLARAPFVAPPLPAPAVRRAPTGEAAELLGPGSWVRTGAAERTVRRLVAGARADLGPLAVLATDAGGRPEVRGGQVRFDIPDQPPDRPFVVRMASYYVTVAGARFSVRVEPGEARVDVDVGVEAGAVDIWSGRRRLARVEAGGRWSAGLLPGRAGAAGAPAADSRPNARRASALRTQASRSGAPGSDGRPGAASDAQDLAAAREARASDPPRAITLYEQVFARGGPAAENALYQIGGIYHDQLRDPARALTAWQRYRALYPRGQLRAETDLSILDTLAELGQSSRALDEGLAFLRRHPGSERRGEVARVAADLARVRGQYRLAATLYAQVVGTQVSPADADDAAFARATCLEALDDDGAQAALSGYLAAYPHGRHAAEARKLAPR
ncbi:MAG TPA: FecR family protein [Polyangia bacterium]|nr:FecR family protein [Polyangia bacterium]